MIGHCIEGGAGAAAVTGPRGDVLGPVAACTWMSLGRHAGDLALKCEQVNENKREVPGYYACEE